MRVLPLFGELSPQEQDAAIQPSRPGERKIVLATNIAETVYFMIEGHAITDQRPKGDTTTTFATLAAEN